MSNKALIISGGWEGHEPARVAAVFQGMLEEAGLNVEMANTLARLEDAESLKTLSVIVPVWTMGTITAAQLEAVLEAVKGGVGLAGCHGGMCDAFRQASDWHFMTGGQWVAHPGNDGVRYTVNLGPERGPLNEGLSDFEVVSEQYYLHVDPAVKVWATTRFPTADGPHVPNGPVVMPQVWTTFFGKGRIFYNALGHNAAVFEIPEARELMRRGLLWASRMTGDRGGEAEQTT